MVARILSVVGARPQFVKAAAVSRALAARGLPEVLVHTGQHHDVGMSEIFFEELEIPLPAHNLGIHGGSHGAMTGRMMAALEPILVAERPDLVLIYGDTNSTLAAALVAAKLHVPVAHVEAGLRSFDRRMPEEINRVVADHLSTVLLCPTQAAIENLAREGITAGVHHVGDVMYDAALHAATKATAADILDRLGLQRGGFAVATIHRQENTDNPAALAAVLDYLEAMAADGPVVFPVHPRTRQAMARAGIAAPRGFVLIDPIGYLDMAHLVQSSRLVLTDSGGLQKEAYFHRVPCITLRSTTEWVETVHAGWNRLWRGPDFVTPRRDIPDYGDGRAAERVGDLLAAWEERSAASNDLATSGGPA